jgi:hypothetical protein
MEVIHASKGPERPASYAQNRSRHCPLKQEGSEGPYWQAKSFSELARHQACGSGPIRQRNWLCAKSQVLTKQVYHLQAGLAVNLKYVITSLVGSLLFRDELLEVLPLFLA